VTTPPREMVYANADITKTEQAREIIAFAIPWWNDRPLHFRFPPR
jgi:hypothetical protein